MGNPKQVVMTTMKSGRWEKTEIRLKILRARSTLINHRFHERPKCYSLPSCTPARWYIAGTQ